MSAWTQHLAALAAGGALGAAVFYGFHAGRRRLVGLRLRRRCRQIARATARSVHPSVVGRGPGGRH